MRLGSAWWAAGGTLASRAHPVIASAASARRAASRSVTPACQASRRDAARGLVEGTRVEVAASTGPRPARLCPCQQLRAAAGIERRPGGQGLDALQAHRRGGVGSRPKPRRAPDELRARRPARARGPGCAGGARRRASGRRIRPPRHAGGRGGGGRPPVGRWARGLPSGADQAGRDALHRLQGAEAEGAGEAASPPSTSKPGAAARRRCAGSSWRPPHPRSSPPALRRGPAGGGGAGARRPPGASAACPGGLGGRRGGGQDQAVAEGQPRRSARREMSRPWGCSMPCRPWPRRSAHASVPATSRSTPWEWAPYGVVLGWHAANSPVWVPTVVTASALAAGNAVLTRPSARAAHGGAGAGGARAAWPADDRAARTRGRATGLGPSTCTRSAHASTATCKRQLAALGAALCGGRAHAPLHRRGLGQRRDDRAGGGRPRSGRPGGCGRRFRQRRQLCMAAKRIIVERAVWEVSSAPGWPPPWPPCGWATSPTRPPTSACWPSAAPAPAHGRRWPRPRPRRAGAGRWGERGAVLHPGPSSSSARGARRRPVAVGELRPAAWSGPRRGPRRDALALANDSPYGLGAAVFGPGEEVESAWPRAGDGRRGPPLPGSPRRGGRRRRQRHRRRPAWARALVFARRVHRAPA